MVDLHRAPSGEQHERPSVTVDTVLFSLLHEQLSVLLVRRLYPPHQGAWAIPGGFVGVGESLVDAARRELAEETGVDDPAVPLFQLRAFGAPFRDPRTRVITVAYCALVRADRLSLHAGSDAAEAAWFPAYEPPLLAFDHADILRHAVERLRLRIEHSAVAFELLPDVFTLTELQSAYECILREDLDKRNFRRKLLSSGILEATPHLRGGGHRPARLYRLRDEAAVQIRSRRLFP